MKSQAYYICFYIFVICITISCKSPERIITKRMKQSGIVVDKKWSKTLENGKKDAGDAWFKMFNRDFEMLEKYFKISLTESDLNKLKYYPIEKYEIDSATLANFGATTVIKNILKLNKETAFYYVLKDDQFVLVTEVQDINGKMTSYQNGALYKAVSNAMKDVLFVRNLPLFFVEIDPRPNMLEKSGLSVFINEQGELMCFSKDGVEKSFKEYLLNIADFWRKKNLQK